MMPDSIFPLDLNDKRFRVEIDHGSKDGDKTCVLMATSNPDGSITIADIYLHDDKFSPLSRTALDALGEEMDKTSISCRNFMRGGNHNTRDPHPPGVQVSGPVKLADPRVRDAAEIACESTTTTPQPTTINTRLGTNVGDTQGNVLPDMLDVSIGTDGAYIDDGDTYDPQPIANTQANRSEL